MKLLRKNNRTYLMLSAAAFMTAGILFYWILSVILDSQMNEELLNSRLHLIENIEKHGIISNDPPFIEVREASAKTVQNEKLSDTLIYDSAEKEDVKCRQLVSFVTINNTSYKIILRSTLLEKSDILLSIIIAIGSVFILLLLSLYFINRNNARKLWQPFYEMLEELKDFSQEDISFSLKGTSDIEEFNELKSVLNKLTVKVISDYQNLKRFTGDASHEIQTPISIIQSKLESYLQYPDLTSEQVSLIQSAYTAAIRLSKMTKSMLLLSRIENRQFPESTPVNIGEILLQQLESLNERIAQKSLTIDKLIDPDFIRVINPTLAESLVSNLAGNAVKHSPPGGRITCVLKNNTLEISNTGDPLTVPPERLFERFFKMDKSSDSFGLGLSIVSEICKINNWKLIYKVAESVHTIKVIF